MNFSKKNTSEKEIKFLKTINQDTRDLYNHYLSELNKSVKNYVVKDGHLRLSSNVHIEDFVFAKRMFQISDFANKYAFLLAFHLIQENKIEETLTFVGYGSYSQLMLDYLVQLLNGVKNNNDYNYEIIKDSVEFNFISTEALSRLKNNVVVIMPISASLSTSLKIRSKIENLESKNKVIHSITALLIVNKNLNIDLEKESINLKKNVGGDSYAHLYNLGWRKLAKGKVSIDNNIEEYFIDYIYSKYYSVERCPLCFPGKGIQEKALFYVEKDSVTPNFIIPMPNSFKGVEVLNEECVITEEAHSFQHKKSNEAHYLHFFNPYFYFKEYEERVRSFFLEKSEQFNDGSEVLLITADSSENKYFVNMIRDTVFKGNASIISYEAKNDFYENYSRFFKDKIEVEDLKIYFVNDVVQRGKTFFLISNFLNFNGKRIDSIFTLLNKSNHISELEIVSKLNMNGAIHSFYNVHLQRIAPKRCPYCERENKYQELADSSYLDSIKDYFLDKKSKLINKQSDNKKQYNDLAFIDIPIRNGQYVLPWEEGFSNDEIIQKYKRHYLFYTNNAPSKEYIRMLVNIELNRFFKDKDDVSDLTIDSIFDELKEKSSIKKVINFFNASIYDSAHSNSIDDIISEIIKDQILKSISDYPFNKIRVVRDLSLKLILNELYGDFLNKDLSEIPEYSYKRVRRFKFLVKLSVKLRSNVILRDEFWVFIRELYKYINNKELLDYVNNSRIYAKDVINNNSLSDLRKNYFNQVIVNIDKLYAALYDFDYFLVAMSKELIYNRNYKSLKLDDITTRFRKKIGGNEEVRAEGNFFHLLKLLEYENVNVIHKFFQNAIKDSNIDGNTSYSELIQNKKIDIYLNEKIEPDNNLSLSFKKFLKIKTESWLDIDQEWKSFFYILNKIHKYIEDPSSMDLKETLQSISKLLKLTLNFNHGDFDHREYSAKTNKLEDEESNKKFNGYKREVIMGYSFKNSDELVNLSFTSDDMMLVDLNHKKSLSNLIVNGVYNSSKTTRALTLLMLKKIDSLKKDSPSYSFLNQSIYFHSQNESYNEQKQIEYFPEYLFSFYEQNDYFLTMKLVDMFLEEDESGIHGVKQNVIGVITLNSKLKYQTSKIRKLLLLKPALLKLFKSIDSNSIEAYLNELKNTSYNESIDHGFWNKFNSLKQTKNIDDDIYSIIYNSIRNQLSVGGNNKRLIKKETTLKEYFKLKEEWMEKLLSYNESFKDSNIIFKLNIDDSVFEESVNIDMSILDEIFFELIYNVIKRNKLKQDLNIKVLYEKLDSEIIFKSNTTRIIDKNYIKHVKHEKMLNHRIYSSYNKSGLSQIDYLSSLLRKNKDNLVKVYYEYDDKGKVCNFITKVPI